MNEKLSATAKVYRRRGLFMVLLAAVMLEATTLTQFFFARRDLKNEAQLRAKNELMVSSLKIESIMENVETATKNMAWVMTEHLDDTNELYDFFHQLLFTNPDIADVAMAFSPSYYPQMGYWFEPSSSRSEGGEIVDEEIGSEQHDYLSMPWFKKVFDSGIGSWSEPYFDNSGGKSMVVTYAEPVFDLDGKMAAVLGTDISLSFLSSLVENVRLYPNSFSKITSREGRLLAASPDSVVSGKALRQEAEMSDTGWTMSIVIPQDEVFESINRLGNRVILLQILGLLLLWFILSRTIKEQAKLRQVEASKEKIESELKIASEIQMSMLPKTFPPFPERTDLDLAAAMYPAKEVGGDLYDFFIKEERLFFCIGDVSGKGVPASLLMAVTRSLFRTVSAHEKSPQRIVSAINDSMTGTNENNMFVTFFCGVLDLRTGHLRYCNAGHNAPFILKGTVGTLPVEPNLPIGVMPGMNFKEQETDLSFDDSIFLYTDGLTEAEDADHRLFGEERVKDLLSIRRTAEEHLEALETAMTKFVGTAPQSDDLTMLFIHYMNKIDPEESERHLILHNDIQQIPQLADFVETIADEMKIEQSLAMGINLALEEAVTNVIMYAYPKGSDGLVDIEAIMRKKSLEFIITDSGIPFDPTQVPVADTTLGVEERPVGGLGIFLVRNIMDTVNYRRSDDGKNILSMTKNI